MTKDVRTTQRSCTKYQNTNLGHLCTKMFIAVEEGKTQTMYSIKSFSLIIIRKAEELPWSFPESFQEWMRMIWCEHAIMQQDHDILCEYRI